MDNILNVFYSFQEFLDIYFGVRLGMSWCGMYEIFLSVSVFCVISELISVLSILFYKNLVLDYNFTDSGKCKLKLMELN